MKLLKVWDKPHEQKCRLNGCLYSVSEAIEMAKDLKVQTASIDAFAMDYSAPCSDDLISFAQHMKQSLDADLSFPIILSPSGVIVDGRHRLIKALVEGKESLTFVRLEAMPSAEEIQTTESN